MRAPACKKRPTLTDIELLSDKRAAKVDHVLGYLGLRSVGVGLVIDPNARTVFRLEVRHNATNQHEPNSHFSGLHPAVPPWLAL